MKKENKVIGEKGNGRSEADWKNLQPVVLEDQDSDQNQVPAPKFIALHSCGLTTDLFGEVCEKCTPDYEEKSLRHFCNWKAELIPIGHGR